MPHRPLTLMMFFLGNFIPAAQLIICAWILYIQTNGQGLLLILTWLYIFPPLALRIMHFIFGKPQGKFTPRDRPFWVWYFGAQLQALFIRFSFLEELLKVMPLVYTNWLRLWGAKIGKAIYWAPRSYVLDRPYLNFGDFVVVGYGVGISAHLMNYQNATLELVLAEAKVGNSAMLGGLSGIGPGAEVGQGEVLPATMQLAPFYKWVEGRRKSINSLNKEDNS